MKDTKDYEDKHTQDLSRFKFVSSMKDDEVEEVFSCNEIIDYLEQQENKTAA